ncbi:PH, RCC1 and FYVE domains-containing protein 1 isoform X1 [Aristolochia californica]|uniref:PH, RCC1 and FYVE domains-containing protein 1 isoform X1 n=1 Tax=Aristolochia californica TaxID=171875 RepID=UPI0035D71655
MDERMSLVGLHWDRRTEQAILALKKGAHLLKYGRRGKPKFCPFRLSPDEKTLIWFSGMEEKHLKLSSVTKIVRGQRTVNFQRQPQPEKESQSFSLIYANGEMSIDLICKDKDQAESWFIGLTALVSRSHQTKHLLKMKHGKGSHSCVNSPASHARRKQNLGLLEDPARFSQVRSLCGSPPQSLPGRSFSDESAYPGSSLAPLEAKSFSDLPVGIDTTLTKFSCLEPEILKDKLNERDRSNIDRTSSPSAIIPFGSSCPLSQKDESLRDVLMWGEGIEGGTLGGGIDGLKHHFDSGFDALVPKLVQSTSMLDVKNISCGSKHVALVTKQGEIFCWGEEKGGRLGHKIKMDVSYPKVVESLIDVHVDSIACGEYYTCAISCSGELYTWGETSQANLDKSRGWWLPHLVAGPLEGLRISNVACGEWHTAVVTSNGQLFTYGDGTFGVLGHGDLQSYPQPKEVDSLKGLLVKSVACGPWHTAAIVEIMADRFHSDGRSGKLFTWGDGDKGRLGHNDRERKLFPTCVAPLVEHDFIQVSCGRMLTVALDVMGQVYTMGSSIHGQLGGSQVADKNYVLVEGKLRGVFVKEISTGSSHVAVLTSTGNVYTWGMGANGRLGLGDVEDRKSPCLVEALKDRQVENVACGCSFTAAICLHRFVSSSDQSLCSGCRMLFGFTRKKHNCYNCGFVFCHSCSNKKACNASLAPNKSKQYRVCDPCFIHLKKLKDSSLRQEMQSPKLPLVTRKPFSDLKVNREETGFSPQMFSPRIPIHQEAKSIEAQKLDQCLPSANTACRWGKVTCPVLFNSTNEDSMMFVHSPKDELAIITTTKTSAQGSTESDQMLTEERQRLRTEAKWLEEQCQMRSEKLKQCRERIDETWLLAKEEAAKCKAAKEVIKVLSTRLNAISGKFPTGKEEKIVCNSTLLNKVDAYLPQILPLSEESLGFNDAKSGFCSTGENVPSNVKFHKERHNNDAATPFHFTYDMSKGTDSRDQNHSQIKSTSDQHLTGSDEKQSGTNGLKNEWVEQDEPGVYITFMMLPCGQKGLKRVRFSRKRFSEKEAERWWEENQLRVYQKYDIEGIISSGIDQMNRC